ncbi:hypothetical protein C8R46DRAFT_1353974 [Mycena filopes]|nr:hypothetical protein C8R46DRAFT_1353974 [Mycena filopes]
MLRGIRRIASHPLPLVTRSPRAYSKWTLLSTSPTTAHSTPKKSCVILRTKSCGRRDFSSSPSKEYEACSSGDPNCICQQPQARLSGNTLENLREFTRATGSTPGALTEDDLSFALQYLKSSDVPGPRATTCTKNYALSHSVVALEFLTKVFMLGERDPRIVQRVVEAWPDIEHWTRHIFTQGIILGTFVVGGEAGAQQTVTAFNTIIPFFSILAAVPEFRTRLLAEPSKEIILSLLLYCWTGETSEAFTSQRSYVPSMSAALPLVELLTAIPDPEAAAVQFFRTLVAHRTELDALSSTEPESYPAKVAANALALLRNLPPPLLLAYHHIQMINHLALGGPYSDALLAQHAIRAVTRVLSNFTSNQSASPRDMELVASSSLGFLIRFMPTKDGFSHVRMALQAGILPAILRCDMLLPDGSDVRAGLQEVLDIIALYTVYPSVLHPFLASVRRTAELDIVDPNKLIHAAYLKLVEFVNERMDMVQHRCTHKISLNDKCATCGKEDAVGAFKACSGCFSFSYCSESCQRRHWAYDHERDCKLTQTFRKEGRPLAMSEADMDGVLHLAFSQINLHGAEIARVWRSEGPTRTPLVSFDFTEDPAGVMTIGKACLDTPPGKTGETGVYFPEMRSVLDGRAYFRSIWETTISRTAHDDDAIVCVFVPQGDTPKAKLGFFGMNTELFQADGTVFERLVRTVEDGRNYGELGPPVFFAEDKQK